MIDVGESNGFQPVSVVSQLTEMPRPILGAKRERPRARECGQMRSR